MIPTRSRGSRGRLRSLAFAACFALTAGLAAEARAQSPEEVKIARQIAVDGLAAYKESQFEKAVDLFEQAKAIYPSGQILRMLGYSLLGLERWEASAQAMEAALASEVGPLNEKDRKDVQEQLAKALAHLGTIRVTSSVAGAELTVNGGAPVALPLTAPMRLVEGKHVLVARAAGHTDATHDLQLEGGQALDLQLDPVAPKPVVVAPPKPLPPKPPPPAPERGSWFAGQKTVGYALAGSGVLLGGAALTAALASASVRSNVEDDVATHEEHFGKDCARGDYRLCVYDRAVINHDADRADDLRDAGLWMGIGAGVLAASGVALVLFSRSERDLENRKSEARIGCSPLGPGLTCSGAF
jgi:tetratricopeptide (TPR) repeat protein